MAEHPYFGRKRSFAKGPDFSAKNDTVAVLRGDKKTPTSVDYRAASVDSKKRCHECKFYSKYGSPESDCDKVVGVVKAEGVCDLFAQRDYAPEVKKEQVIAVEIRTQ